MLRREPLRELGTGEDGTDTDDLPDELPRPDEVFVGFVISYISTAVALRIV